METATDNPSFAGDIRHTKLKADCGKCFGLCCVSLYFSAADGFPADKEAGIPCINLLNGFRCGVHACLKEEGLKGCLVFDCFGAGQTVSQTTFAGRDWRQNPELAGPMFGAFNIVRQLHEMLWYLAEALTLAPAQPLHENLRSMLEETEHLALLSPSLLSAIDVPSLRIRTGELLRQASALARKETGGAKGIQKAPGKRTGKPPDFAGAGLRNADLTCRDLRGACLIAADLRSAVFDSTDVLGADFRDADIRGANLFKSLFLTQAQVNAAKGDENTKLPPLLDRPLHW